MRYGARALLTLTGLACAAHAASAQSPLYVTLSAGAFLRSEESYSTTIFKGAMTGPGTNTSTYDPGPVANLAVGVPLPLGFRVEGEVGYENARVSSASPLSLNGAFPTLVGNRLSLQSGGNIDSFTATVNGFYDLPLGGRFVPYVGAGFGLAHNDQEAAVFAGPGVARFTGNGGSATKPAILAELGVTIGTGTNWSIVPSYRFEHVFTSAGHAPDNANVLRLGLRYSF